MTEKRTTFFTVTRAREDTCPQMHTTHSPKHTTHNTQHTTHNTQPQHTTHDTKHTTHHNTTQCNTPKKQEQSTHTPTLSNVSEKTHKHPNRYAHALADTKHTKRAVTVHTHVCTKTVEQRRESGAKHLELGPVLMVPAQTHS